MDLAFSTSIDVIPGFMPGTHPSANPDYPHLRKRAAPDNPPKPVGRWVPATSAGMTTL